MVIEYKLIEALPPLAWLAKINNGLCSVIHGKNVETKDLFFVEGAWNGEFIKGKFDSSDWFCGTGGIIENDSIVFSTPSHVTSGLFSSAIKNTNTVLVSNSLHFLCAYAGYHLDAQYLDYEIDFNKILFGINDYKESAYVLDSDSNPVNVNVHYYRNITVNAHGEVAVCQKEKKDPFESFQSYYDSLIAAIGGMVANAQDENRKFTYDLVTTISKGYDAPCCAAIARKFGCDTAVTFKAVGKYADDSGVEVAQALGYHNIVERDANSYLSNTSLIEAEAISSGDLGTDFQFAAFDDIFRNKLVFIGERGDKVWNISFPSCNDNYSFDDQITGLGASERKLWLGYISVPLPLYGASSWSSIQRISQSEEMKSWSIGGNYDRPIPRRICEEAGIERQLFGISKHGAGIVLRYDWGGRAKRRMSKNAANSFDKYVKKKKHLDIVQLVHYFWKAKKIYLSRIGLRIPDKSSFIEKSQISNATTARYLFPWASEIIQERYMNILER